MKTNKKILTKLENKINSIIPVITYIRIKDQKSLILKDNKGKTGIYRWTNLINSKSYIGSAIDLRKRFWVYFSPKRLVSSNMAIYKAILKYDYEKFKLEILEYCNPEILLVREQYYVDFLRPKYNLLQKAGSNTGYKHTEETLMRFKTRVLSNNTRFNLSKAATGRVLSEETKTKISCARKGMTLSNKTREKLSLIGTIRIGIPIEVRNVISNEVKEYPSLTLASSNMGVSRTAIRKAIKKDKIIKGIYSAKLIKTK
jgi:group I intron endonuclease